VCVACTAIGAYLRFVAVEVAGFDIECPGFRRRFGLVGFSLPVNELFALVSEAATATTPPPAVAPVRQSLRGEGRLDSSIHGRAV
jgi:hypothetical protein